MKLKLKDCYKAAVVGSAAGIGTIIVENVIMAVTGNSRVGRATRNLFPLTCYVTGTAIGSGLGMSLAEYFYSKGDDELD